MLDKYEEISNSQGDEGMYNELIELGQEAGLPDKLSEFLITQDITIKKKKDSDENWIKDLKTTLISSFIYNPEIKIPETKYYSYKITKFFFIIVMAPLFNSFIFLCIGINTVILALEKYPEYDTSTQQIFNIVNYIFTVIFAFEVT